MNFLTFQERLKHFTAFSLQDIRKIDPNFDRRRLTEWQQRGLITKILRGRYMMRNRTIDETALFSIAHAICRPSYVSLQTALSFYDFIPESTFAITSVTTRKTATFHTPIGAFAYRSIRPDLFFGYAMLPDSTQPCVIAEPEKAVLDTLYLFPVLRTLDDLEGWRMNYEQLQDRLNMSTFQRYQEAFGSKALDSRVSIFLSNIHHAFS